MKKRLTHILLEDNLINEKQIDMALQRQMMTGGRIGTSLIQLGFLKEDQIAQKLSKLYGVPYVTEDMINDISDNAKKSIPAKIAEKYGVIPLKREKRKLWIGMINPNDLEALNDLKFLIGCDLEVYVCHEMRMDFALFKQYGIEKEKGYITVVDQEGRVKLHEEARKIKPEQAPEEIKKGFTEISDRLVGFFAAEAALRILRAKGFDEIGKSLPEIITEITANAVLLQCQKDKGKIIGWKGNGKDWGRSKAKRMSFDLEKVSSLIDILGENYFYYGKKSNVPADELFIERLCGVLDKEILFIPINVTSNLSFILYADNGEKAIPEDKIDELLFISYIASLRFRLTLEP